MEWLRRTTRNAAAWGTVNDSVLSVMCCANREFIFDSDSEQQETSLCQGGFQPPHPRACEQNQPAEGGRGCGCGAHIPDAHITGPARRATERLGPSLTTQSSALTDPLNQLIGRDLSVWSQKSGDPRREQGYRLLCSLCEEN